MPDIFSFDDYKKYLLKLVSSSEDSKFRSNLIRAIGCQKSFFSQVLNGSVHLTPDHAANLVEYLQLDELSADYFVALVNWARAGSPALKNRLKKHLDQLKSQSTQPSERLKWPSLQSIEKQSVYYSSFIFMAVHIIVSIKDYQDAVSIANRLKVPVRRIQRVLDWLISAKLIEKTARGYKVLEDHLHLKNDSHLIEIHHAHWRDQALNNLRAGDDESIHYSAVFTMSQDDFLELKSMVTNFIKRSTNLIAPSRPEDIYALGLDCFRL